MAAAAALLWADAPRASFADGPATRPAPATTAPAPPLTNPNPYGYGEALSLHGTLVSARPFRLTLRRRVDATPRADPLVSPLVTVRTDRYSTFVVDGARGRWSDLAPGMDVSVIPLPEGLLAPGHFEIVAESVGFTATVARVDGTTITLHLPDGRGSAADVRVATDDRTRFSRMDPYRHNVSGPPRTAALADLRPGDRVRVAPASGTARVVYQLPPGFDYPEPLTNP